MNKLLVMLAAVAVLAGYKTYGFMHDLAADKAN